MSSCGNLCYFRKKICKTEQSDFSPLLASHITWSTPGLVWPPNPNIHFPQLLSSPATFFWSGYLFDPVPSHRAAPPAPEFLFILRQIGRVVVLPTLGLNTESSCLSFPEGWDYGHLPPHLPPILLIFVNSCNNSLNETKLLKMVELGLILQHLIIPGALMYVYWNRFEAWQK